MIAQGGTFLPVHVIGMELSLYCFLDYVFHVSGFLGWDAGVLKWVW